MSAVSSPPAHRQRLIRASGFELRVESGSVQVRINGTLSGHDAQALRLLDFFSTPHSLEEAMQALHPPTQGAAQWMERSAAILALVRAGALVPADASHAALPLTRGYAGASVHVRMLDDVRRTRAYLDAIAATVRPGDVVVDIGTGTGILAMAAARAGARRVYAVEASGIADTAQAMFVRNGLADRITLIRGWSTAITLPERADVMVAELLGVDPFDEQIAVLTNDARARLLTDRARLVPYGFQVCGVPVRVPDSHIGRVTFVPASTTRWADAYGFDFSPLLETMSRSPVTFGLRSPEAHALPALTAPIRVADVDLRSLATGIVECRAQVTAAASGTMNGLVLYFDVQLAPGHTLTTAPDVADETNHWGNRVVLLPSPVEVTAGETLTVHVERRHGRFAVSCERHQP